MTTKSKSYTTAAVHDADGLKASFTPPTEDTVYAAGDGLDGAFVAVGNTFGAGRLISVTTTASSGSYSGTPVLVEGEWEGREVSEEITLAIDGDETVYGVQPFAFPPGVTISLPAQGGSGAMTFGVADIVGPGMGFAGFRALADGNVEIASRGGAVDTIAAQAEVLEDVRFYRLGRATVPGVTIYWDSETR
jgi:hypothetical protein